MLTAAGCNNPAQPVSGAPIIAAAGDIACDPASSQFNSGRGTSQHCHERATSDLLVKIKPASVLALGDEQYACGGDIAFLQSYAATWGRVKSITHPVPGNQEYDSGSAPDCDRTGHAAGYFAYFGKASGTPRESFYSFDIGTWHLIALNANCAKVGGCGVGSAQEKWLRSDLARHPSKCTLAYWHQPRFSSGSHGNNPAVAVFWQDLFRAGADVVLNGHDHVYERFAPQDPAGRATPSGLREFVVGTGGEDHGSFSSVQANSEARNANTFGILELTLETSSYRWSFVPEAGSSFTDSGSGSCH